MLASILARKCVDAFVSFYQLTLLNHFCIKRGGEREGRERRKGGGEGEEGRGRGGRGGKGEERERREMREGAGESGVMRIEVVAHSLLRRTYACMLPNRSSLSFLGRPSGPRSIPQGSSAFAVSSRTSPLSWDPVGRETAPQNGWSFSAAPPPSSCYLFQLYLEGPRKIFPSV